jgi:hypothetical protein
MSMRIVILLDGPEITVLENEHNVELFVVESQVIADDEKHAKEVRNSFPDDLKHYVEDYMEPEWYNDTTGTEGK